MNGNGTRNPETILAEIEQTRSQMDYTLNAIEQRLTPGEWIDRGLDYLRNSGGREFVSNLGASVKDNPLPATLVGVGLAWLMFTQQQANRGAPRSSTAAGGVASKASDMLDRAENSASAAKERVADAWQATRDSVDSTSQRARDAWNRTTESTRQQFDRARGQYEHILHEQPLALGVIGLGVGALLGAMAPRTRTEDELMGSAARAVKEDLVAAGREQLHQAQKAATRENESSLEREGSRERVGNPLRADQEEAEGQRSGPA